MADKKNGENGEIGGIRELRVAMERGPGSSRRFPTL
jgi:hypothetical protein